MALHRTTFRIASGATGVAVKWGWETFAPSSAVLQELPPENPFVGIDLERAEGGTAVCLRLSGLPRDLSTMHGERCMHYLGRPDTHRVTQRAGKVLVS